MRKRNTKIASALMAFVLLALAPAGLLAQAQTGIPTHPKELKYTQLDYTPPKRDK
ncbi:MAG: hypothetical protein H0T60_13870, partial [Acidobacteria bacterium]|nr:hypothetical protein [Acidobacteriota bacterium]